MLPAKTASINSDTGWGEKGLMSTDGRKCLLGLIIVEVVSTTIFQPLELVFWCYTSCALYYI